LAVVHGDNVGVFDEEGCHGFGLPSCLTTSSVAKKGKDVNIDGITKNTYP
jgi:hypothetical protein